MSASTPSLFHSTLPCVVSDAGRLGWVHRSGFLPHHRHRPAPTRQYCYTTSTGWARSPLDRHRSTRPQAASRASPPPTAGPSLTWTSTSCACERSSTTWRPGCRGATGVSSATSGAVRHERRTADGRPPRRSCERSIAGPVMGSGTGRKRGLGAVERLAGQHFDGACLGAQGSGAQHPGAAVAYRPVEPPECSTDAWIGQASDPPHPYSTRLR